MMAMIGFTLIHCRDFEQPFLAHEVLSCLLAAPDFLKPKKYGRFEPLELDIRQGDLDPMVDLWMGAGASSEAQEGLLLLGCGRRNGYMIRWDNTASDLAAISGNFQIEKGLRAKTRVDRIRSLVTDLVRITAPAYGQVENKDLPEAAQPFDFVHRLPDIPWLSIYGEPYVRLFGRSRIARAPFFSSEESETGHYFLQASRSVFDPVPPEVRSAIKEHFGAQSFMSFPRWRYKDGIAPDFQSYRNSQSPQVT